MSYKYSLLLVPFLFTSCFSSGGDVWGGVISPNPSSSDSSTLGESGVILPSFSAATLAPESIHETIKANEKVAQSSQCLVGTGSNLDTKKICEEWTIVTEAINKNNVQVCQNISDEIQRKTCEINVKLSEIIHSGSIRDCENISAAPYIKLCKENIVIRDAISKWDESICSAEDTPHAKNFCIKKVRLETAMKKWDESYCMSLPEWEVLWCRTEFSYYTTKKSQKASFLWYSGPGFDSVNN